MDTSFTIKPRDTIVRKVAGPSNVVRTDLAPSLSVNAGQRASVSDQTAQNSDSHDPALDAQCQSLLNREREARKRRRDSRDEALLRQKAYARVAVEPPSPSETDSNEDARARTSRSEPPSQPQLHTKRGGKALTNHCGNKLPKHEDKP